MQAIIRSCAAILIGMGLAAEVHAQSQTPPGFEENLRTGKLADAEKQLDARLKETASDDQSRFALGVVQFLRAIEARAQGFYRYGYRSDLGAGVTNLPIPMNPSPKPIDAKILRAMFQTWLDDLKRVEATLAAIKATDLKLSLHLGRIRLDLNGDGKAEANERLWTIYSAFDRRNSLSEEEIDDFVINCDRGDVEWLRGYCHLLMAITETILAHDFTDLFNHSAYNLFTGARPPAAFFVERQDKPNDFGFEAIADLVAAIHMIRLPVIEPERLKATLAHLESVITLSRSSWKFILAETDDDHEWIPNPKQKAVGSSVRVTQEMIEGWNLFLNEFEAILAGKKLAPFWRGKDRTLGINVRRVLTEPRTFDLVLWVQGASAAPYLEKGEISKPDTWQRLNRIFQGEFIGFAFWFN